MYYDIDGNLIGKKQGQRLLAKRKPLVKEKIGRVTITTQHTVIGLQCVCGCMKGIFETKVLGGKRDGEVVRHHTIDKALKCHSTTVALVRIIG